MSKAQVERPEAAEDKLTGLGEKLERTDKVEKAEGLASAEEPKRPSSGGGDLTIYLFGRTGREKEEWFRRFLLASRMKSEGRGGSLPGICKSGRFPTEVCTGSHTKMQTAMNGTWMCLVLFTLLTHILYFHRHASLSTVRIPILLSM